MQTRRAKRATAAPEAHAKGTTQGQTTTAGTVGISVSNAGLLFDLGLED